jgi:hypothetical protein
MAAEVEICADEWKGHHKTHKKCGRK